MRSETSVHKYRWKTQRAHSLCGCICKRCVQGSTRRGFLYGYRAFLHASIASTVFIQKTSVVLTKPFSSENNSLKFYFLALQSTLHISHLNTLIHPVVVDSLEKVPIIKWQGDILSFLRYVAMWACLTTRLTLRLIMSYIYIYIYGAPSKARTANVVYIWTYVWQRWNSLFLFAAKCFNTESMQRGFLCHICV